jgi:hypothetical protein
VAAVSCQMTVYTKILTPSSLGVQLLIERNSPDVLSYFPQHLREVIPTSRALG